MRMNDESGTARAGDMLAAERPVDAQGRVYHVGVAPGEVAANILLVGDPARAQRVASRFERIDHDVRHREYVTITGVFEGMPVSVVGTGMGADNTEIAVIELCAVVDDPLMIRCGSSGALAPECELGDLVITRASVRLENTSLAYVCPGFPAVADTEVVLALAQAADEIGAPWRTGITATAPGFYGAQGRHVDGFRPLQPDMVAQLAGMGTTNLEMETSCLLTLAAHRGFRAGAVCAIYATRFNNRFVSMEQMEQAEAACVSTGLRALQIAGRLREQRGSRALWHPGLVR